MHGWRIQEQGEGRGGDAARAAHGQPPAGREIQACIGQRVNHVLYRLGSDPPLVDQWVTDVPRVRVDARRQVSGGGLQRHTHTQTAVLLEPSMAGMADAYEDASCACRKQEDGASVCMP